MSDVPVPDQPPMPTPPVSLADMAVFHHEMFTSYVKAGFDMAQALALVIAWIAKPS